MPEPNFADETRAHFVLGCSDQFEGVSTRVVFFNRHGKIVDIIEWDARFGPSKWIRRQMNLCIRRRGQEVN